VSVKRAEHPVLRLAFNKLLGRDDDRTDIIRRMLIDLANNHNRSQSRALFLWKLATWKHSMEKGMATLRQRPNIVDGAMMLDRINKRYPRHTLWSLARHARRM
jgi:hypothetical protein